MLKAGQSCVECRAPVSGTAGLGLCSACALKEALRAQTTPTAGEADDSASRPKASGDYELLDKIARGGMGGSTAPANAA